MSVSSSILNIVGAGKVGRTLGRLFGEHAVFTIGDILNRTVESASEAVAFIGAGRAVADYGDMQQADAWMIACADDTIATCCEALAGSGRLHSGSVVFHCSGALTSGELAAAASQGARLASIHPIRSFADPTDATASFAGTWCGTEGDAAALALLSPAFEAIGARLVAIDPKAKTIYHAAAVIACNYLVTMMDSAVHAYGAAGVPQEIALELMEPLVRGTVDNVFRHGPARALTGPIARGDLDTVRRQSAALNGWNSEYGTLYDQLARLTMDLARRGKN